MASYKSQFNPSPRVDQPSLYPPQRAPTTRLPTPSITPTAAAVTQLSSSSHSRIQKGGPSGDEQMRPSRGTIGQRVPVPKYSVATQPRQGSTTPSVSTAHASPIITAPRTARQASSSRLPTKLEVIGSTRTPSLVSGSSTSTVDSPRSNVLRRQPSSVRVPSGKPARDGSMSSQEERQPIKVIPGGYMDPFSETVMGITMPPSSSILALSDFEIEVPDNRYYEYDVGPADILPIPTPQYALSTTSSTRYSESPGPFSVSSTPTSMSSYSPGVALSIKSTTRTKQTSPMQSRTPVIRHRTPDESSVRQQHTLSSVRESTTSSSSASTVMADGAKRQEQQSAIRLPAPPPSPPVHKSFAQRSATRYQTELARNEYRSPPAPEQKPQRQAPPELAHLADHAQIISSELRKPTRPSRDGTSAIYGLQGPSPVIQSNMSTFPSSHKRTPSSESKSGMVPNGKARFGIPATSSRNPSPNPSLAGGLTTNSRGPTRGPTPESQNNVEKQRSKTLPTPTPTPSPAPAPAPAPAPTPSPSKTSRFGFFSRRTKTEAVCSAPKPEKKHTRRGPVAGTGHEGYGRSVLRGRSGSSASGTSIGRSASAGTTNESLEHTPSSRKSSMTSTTSTEMDDFFLDRLAPVVIRGAGSSTELSRSPEAMHSDSSLDLARAPRQAAKKTMNLTQQSLLGTQRPTLLPSAMSDPVRGGSPMKKMTLGSRRPSESDDDAKKSFLPALASRRTSHAANPIDGASLSKVTSSGSNAEKKRNDSVSDMKNGKSSKPKKEKAEKAAPKLPRKWNFFQRAHAVPRKENPVVESPATENRVAPSRSVAHYAPIDSKSGLALEDIEQLMQEADSSPEDASVPTKGTEAVHSEDEPEKERMLSMLLPPLPVLPVIVAPSSRSASPKVPLQPPQHKLTLDTTFQNVSYPSALASQSDLTPVTDFSPCSSPLRPLSPIDPIVLPESAPVLVPAFVAPPQIMLPPGPPPTNLPPKPSRLKQVGRIPPVVSRHRPNRQPTPKSFSRPFVADQPRPQVPAHTTFDSVVPLTATVTGPMESYPVLQGIDTLNHASTIATLSPSAEESDRRSEFFKFARKTSEVSYSSSSGAWSFAPASGTAVVPKSGAPQSEDEVWNEYDDLIDEVLSPDEILMGEVRGKFPRKHPSLEPLPLRTASNKMNKSGSSSTGPSIPSLHLRRSRLLAVLHSAQSPTSPVSLSEYIQGYGERNLSVIDPVTGRLSFPASARMSTGSSSRVRPNSARSSLPASLNLSARQSKATLNSNSDKDRDSTTANKYRDTRLMEMAETQKDGLVSMANLRFGALMTSKWLSFGRVLFSPVHFELKDPSEDRILVIDGLGKDWSYYCALTYPEATVYNLGPGTASATPNVTAPEPWSTLPNHRHISHQSLADSLPFPKGFFKGVVFRFPSALSSAVHRTVISECKRVLQPGGHLELIVLDLDLVNMGNRARRAVRGLKVKMQVADEQISLRNVSDEIMAGLGRKGFVECNRCFVGVPVAGKLLGPDEGDTAEAGKRKGSIASSPNKAISSSTPPPNQPKPEVSFSDLLNAQPSTESTNNGIAEMVARVGRWWYSRCYESLVLPEAGEPGVNSSDLLETSIWRDENLIEECEKRGTSFRLLIGYAQKPEVRFRRTVSV